MSRFTSDQLAFAATKQRYLARDEALEFLKTMDIKYSVGHWSAGDFCDRFAPPGYNSDNPTFKNDFEGQCRRTKAAGIDCIEIHQSVFEKGGAATPMEKRAAIECKVSEMAPEKPAAAPASPNPGTTPLPAPTAAPAPAPAPGK